MSKDRVYPGKILLVGEYTVIHGGRALAIPYTDLYCQWTENGIPESLHSLQRLKSYMLKAYYNGLLFNIDFDLWEWDLTKGLSLDSNIKQGYGAGSSGAVVAAVFDRYYTNKEELSILQVKEVLALLETHFHGSSSGIDPLVSYFQKAIIKEKNSEFNLIELELKSNDFAWGLIDTGKARSTSPLVNSYMRLFEHNPIFQKAVQALNIEVDQAINQMIDQDLASVFKSIKQISKIQFKHFQEMIPENVSAIWEASLSSSKHVIKLCGAGGGGYMLVLSKDIEAFKEACDLPVQIL